MHAIGRKGKIKIHLGKHNQPDTQRNQAKNKSQPKPGLDN